MKKNRLLRLATVLRRVHAKAPETFCMYSWQSGVGNPLKRPDCGAACCAFGYACHVPEFKVLGLKMRRSGEPTFSGTTGFDAAAYFFGLSAQQADFLFDNTSYASGRAGYAGPLYEPNARQVADRIEQFVAEAPCTPQ